MSEIDYCDDYFEAWNEDCDGDCEHCNNKECDEHPQQKLKRPKRKEQKNE